MPNKRPSTTPAGDFCTKNAGVTPKHPRLEEKDSDDEESPPRTPHHAPVEETPLPPYTPLLDEDFDGALDTYLPENDPVSPIKVASNGGIKVRTTPMHDDNHIVRRLFFWKRTSLENKTVSSMAFSLQERTI